MLVSSGYVGFLQARALMTIYNRQHAVDVGEFMFDEKGDGVSFGAMAN